MQSLIKGDETAQRRLSTMRSRRPSALFRTSTAIAAANHTVKGPSPRWRGSIRGSSPNSRMIQRSAGSPRRTRWARPVRPWTPCTRPRKRPRNQEFTRRWPAATRTTSSTPPRTSARSSRSLPKGHSPPRRSCRPTSCSSTTPSPRFPPSRKTWPRHVADNPKTWDALLKRPFHTLKADGPFIFDRADVDAEVTDQLASLGDPPTTLRPTWYGSVSRASTPAGDITSARRVLPGAREETPSASNPNLRVPFHRPAIHPAPSHPRPVPWEIPPIDQTRVESRGIILRLIRDRAISSVG